MAYLQVCRHKLKATYTTLVKIYPWIYYINSHVLVIRMLEYYLRCLSALSLLLPQHRKPRLFSIGCDSKKRISLPQYKLFLCGNIFVNSTQCSTFQELQQVLNGMFHSHTIIYRHILAGHNGCQETTHEQLLAFMRRHNISWDAATESAKHHFTIRKTGQMES